MEHNILGTPQNRKSRIIPDLAEQLNKYYSNPKNWEKDNEKKPEKKQPKQTILPNIKGFIYVPLIDRSVYTERILLNKNYNEQQTEIQNLKINNQNVSITTPYQFKEFLKHLRDVPSDENTAIYNEITKVREPWRANNLNARFEKRDNGLYMISENFLENGNYKTIETKLENVLMKNKLPGISLDEWLNSSENHGLPLSNIANGKLDYWSPSNKSVAGFLAYSDGASLDCYWDPDNEYASLGVFACAEGTRESLGGK